MDQIAFDLKQLRAFITVVDLGSFSLAAEQLNQTQSSISQLIQNLEQGLDCKLLERKKRPIRSTLAGAELYVEANKFLLEAKLIQDRLQAIKRGKVNRIKIGMVDSILGLAGVELLQYFDSKADKINQTTGTAPDLLASLQSGKVDIIISVVSQDVPQELAVYPVLSEKFSVVTPAQWEKNGLAWLCKNKNYVEYESWTPTGSQTNNWLRWRKLETNSHFSVARAETVLDMVAKGYGWSLTTPTFLALNVDYLDEIECYPLPEPGIKRELAVICRKGEMASIMDEVISSIQTIIVNNKVEVVLNKWDWMREI